MPKRMAYSKRRECVIAYAPLILWVAVILILGSGTGSMAQTSRFIRPLIEFFFPSAAPDTFLLIHAAIRKTAHFVEYAILAFLASRAFMRSDTIGLRSRWAVGAIAVVLVTAAIDELNQSYQVTRTGSPWDVLLDVCGGLFAILVVYAYRRRNSSISASESGKGS